MVSEGCWCDEWPEGEGGADFMMLRRGGWSEREPAGQSHSALGVQRLIEKNASD